MKSQFSYSVFLGFFLWPHLTSPTTPACFGLPEASGVKTSSWFWASLSGIRCGTSHAGWWLDPTNRDINGDLMVINPLVMEKKIMAGWW